MVACTRTASSASTLAGTRPARWVGLVPVHGRVGHGAHETALSAGPEGAHVAVWERPPRRDPYQQERSQCRYVDLTPRPAGSLSDQLNVWGGQGVGSWSSSHRKMPRLPSSPCPARRSTAGSSKSGRTTRTRETGTAAKTRRDCGSSTGIQLGTGLLAGLFDDDEERAWMDEDWTTVGGGTARRRHGILWIPWGCDV
jgi:hypothetical protein